MADHRLTHHAYKRFCERVYPCSRKIAEAHVLSPQVRKWLAMGVTRICRHRGLHIVAQDGVVLTVMPDTWKSHK